MAIFGDGLDYAALAAKNEKQRQGIINAGLAQINAIFGGGTVPFYTPITQTYSPREWQGGARDNVFYTLGKQGEFKPYYARRSPSLGTRFAQETLPVFNPIGEEGMGLITGQRGIDAWKRGDVLGILTGGLFGFGKDTPTPREQVNRRIRRNNIFTKQDQTFEGFNDAFYNQREQDYLNYALPELSEQYRANRDAILYGLANRGLLRGSVQNKASSDLERATGKARQGLVDTAIGQSQQLRRDVEAARQAAIQQLYTASKPSEAISQAISTAGGFRAPSTFAPIANLFENLARQYYANQVFNNYRTTGGAYYPEDTYSLPSSPITL